MDLLKKILHTLNHSADGWCAVIYRSVSLLLWPTLTHRSQRACLSAWHSSVFYYPENEATLQGRGMLLATLPPLLALIWRGRDGSIPPTIHRQTDRLQTPATVNQPHRQGNPHGPAHHVISVHFFVSRIKHTQQASWQPVVSGPVSAFINILILNVPAIVSQCNSSMYSNNERQLFYYFLHLFKGSENALCSDG